MNVPAVRLLRAGLRTIVPDDTRSLAAAPVPSTNAACPLLCITDWPLRRTAFALPAGACRSSGRGAVVTTTINACLAMLGQRFVPRGQTTDVAGGDRNACRSDPGREDAERRWPDQPHRLREAQPGWNCAAS